jgi:hypothetical protein
MQMGKVATFQCGNLAIRNAVRNALRVMVASRSAAF